MPSEVLLIVHLILLQLYLQWSCVDPACILQFVDVLAKHHFHLPTLANLSYLCLQGLAHLFLSGFDSCLKLTDCSFVASTSSFIARYLIIAEDWNRQMILLLFWLVLKNDAYLIVADLIFLGRLYQVLRSRNDYRSESEDFVKVLYDERARIAVWVCNFRQAQGVRLA
jgi:hypothetical protein